MQFQLRAQRQVLGAVEHLLHAGLDNAAGRGGLEPADHAQPEPHGRFVREVFQRAVHVAVHHIDRPHLDAMAPRVLHELRR
ncbi:hypothetical protein D3C71_1979290 [compost metagenome]